MRHPSYRCPFHLQFCPFESQEFDKYVDIRLVLISSNRETGTGFNSREFGSIDRKYKSCIGGKDTIALAGVKILSIWIDGVEPRVADVQS